MHTITIEAGLAGRLCAYLDAPVERMAFLLSQPIDCSAVSATTPAAWTAVDTVYLTDDADYALQTSDAMELADHVRPRVLQAASAAKAALIEVHTHGPTPWPAAFSCADLLGLREVAPQMLWRLPGRPYTAIVLHDQDLDALVWTAKTVPPRVPAAVSLGDTLLQPTGLSAARLA
jgi:hypothetical protein